MVPTPNTPILFIGPVRAGKSTIARLVAGKLHLPMVSLDELRWNYYREIGFDDQLAAQVRAQGGFLALVFYWQLFDAHSVKRILVDYPTAVIDCGAGVGPYENAQTLQAIKLIFDPLPNVFLLLPSKDAEESLQILKERDPTPPIDLKFDIIAHFLLHPGYRLLAKHVIFTKDKSPEQSSSEVIGLLS